MVTTMEVAWLAGLLEGEGSFNHNHHSPGIRIDMTDEDVIRRAALLLRGPDYVPPSRVLPSGKVAHRVAVSGTRSIQWMLTLFPLMGERRQARIRAIVLIWQKQPQVGKSGSLKTHCKRGHEFTPENTRRTNTRGRQCRICDALRTRRSASKRGIRKTPFSEPF